jgi:rare lipoprotein A
VVSVTDLSDGLSTTCTVEDRGPHVGGRIIDLSEETFSQLTGLSEGVIEVRISW